LFQKWQKVKKRKLVTTFITSMTHVCVYSHSNVLNDSVLYIQDDLEATSDDLEYDIYDL